MNNNLHSAPGSKSSAFQTGIMAAAVVASMFIGTVAVNAQPSPKSNWYLTAGAQGVVDATGSGPDIDFGNQVLVHGKTHYDEGHSLNIAVGREFNIGNEVGNLPNLRIEGQYWDGQVGRKSVDLGAVNPSLYDKVKLRALFLNGFIRFAKTDHLRLWFGPGIGYAWTRFPDASYATPCGCLKAAKSDGLAWQVKLQAERMISAKTSIFGELGYLKFQGADSGGLPAAHYNDLGLTVVGVGVITRF
jgi:hypothetical protein